MNRCDPGRGSAPKKEAVPVSASDKVKNAAQSAKGDIKKAAGHATNNPRLEAEGQADKTGGSLKQAGEKVKDAFK
jgi:uncharacterized protein YjbJ (UPF0337 family)